ncbi:MAG: hypothetical protein ABJQ70_10500 [Roseobacter sp.]
MGDTILGQGGNDTNCTSGSDYFWDGGGGDLFTLSATFPLSGDFRYINGKTSVETLDTRAVSVNRLVNLETGLDSRPDAPIMPAEEFHNFENLVTGGGNDFPVSSDLLNEIDSNGDNDSVDGRAGSDAIFGGAIMTS